MKKKLILFFSATLLGMGVGFAQAKLIKSATRDLANQKYEKALEAIDQAIVNEETVSSPDAWLVRGRVYTAIASNPLLVSKYPDAAATALTSFEKALTLDQTPKTEILVTQEFSKLGEVYYTIGSDAFPANDFVLATKAFETAFFLYSRAGIIDTGAIFNIALCAARAGQLEKAAEKYQFLVDVNYPQSNIYAGLADVYSKMDKKDEASQTMDIALERYPDDYTVYISASSANLLLGKSDKAEKILNTAIEKFPTSDFLYFAMGVAYENNNRPEDAEKAYLKALELKPDYFDAIFNLGAFYVNQGIKVKEAADQLPLSESEKYDTENARANEILTKAIPFLLKVVENQPDNLAAMTTLKDIYVHLRQMDKAKELNEKIEAKQGTQGTN